MVALIQVLIISILSMAHVVQGQKQPCLICEGALMRIWSLMSRQGDRYLRITNQGDDDNNNHKIVDCGGGLQNDNFTSLLQIRDKTTMDETRYQLVLEMSSNRYDLYAPSAGGPLLAMPASEGAVQTDGRNNWAPQRLEYEHRLFTVFQSVKFRGYYLSCDGNGKAVLQKLINEAYREPNQLFLVIDPGTAIKGVTFGTNVVSRKKREIPTQEDANPKWESWKSIGQVGRYRTPHYRPTTQPPTTIPITQAPPEFSSVFTNFKLPQRTTFVLCFWIKTESINSQLVSVTEQRPEPEKEPKKPSAWYWKRYKFPYQQTKTKTTEKDDNIINVSIEERMLKLQVGYNRITRTVYNCDISDGKFHQYCISLNHQYQLEVYQDSKVVMNRTLTGVERDFRKTQNSRATRRGTFMLGRTHGMTGGRFDGSLFQVNMWDQYPSFRIVRIATNCACGGGNLVNWQDLLNGTMSEVNLENNSQCPKLEGYNYDERLQNRLI